MAARSLAARDPATRDDPALPYHLRWVWNGRPIDGRDVLVRCYHGLGDTIQFARFLPLLAVRAASVTVEVQPRLLDLIAGIGADVRLVPFDPARPLPPAEVDVGITELDFALRATPELAPPPYLSVEPAALPKGTVALCYGAGDWDAGRNVPPALFAPLCALAPCVTLMPEPTDLAVRNPEGCPFDMAATARLVAGAALVITVDTMIAHLAGALGRPTWLLLKAEPDWRWAPQRTDSPWYPSMRLYAQPRPRDWATVMARVARDLAAERLMVPMIPVSWGELLDKITILEIKRTRLGDAAALANVEHEHRLLTEVAADALTRADLAAPLERLRAVNTALWEIEDAIREEEAAGRFEAEFIRLARAVYHRNDERAAVKREINLLLGSALIEEKSYKGSAGGGPA